MTIPLVAEGGAAEAIRNFVAAHRGALLQLCESLVAADSANPPGNTVAAAASVESFLAVHGQSAQILANVPSKPNLVAQCHGAGPGAHLVLNGHLDTISPGDESRWTVPVHRLLRQDGRLYGLGMGNMKGAVAALTLAYLFLARHRTLWRGTLSLTAVADETIFGPHGAAWLLETMPDLAGDALICGEGPGSMQLAVAEKGVLWLSIEASGEPGQGMLMRRGLSPIAQLAHALSDIDAINDQVVKPPPELACLVEHAGDHGLRISVNPGTVKGGSFISQAATFAAAEVDIRVPPGLTIAEIEKQIAAMLSRSDGLALRRIKGWDPSWTAPSASIARCVGRAAETVRGTAPNPVVRLPGSDASRWRARGVPAICYGPQPLLASGIDDFVFEQDLLDCAQIYALAALDYFRGKRAI